MTDAAPFDRPRVAALRAWAVDGALILTSCALALPYQVRSDDVPHPRWAAVLGAAVLIAPLTVRRRWPVPVFGVIVALAVTFGAWDARLVGTLALPIALYTVAATSSRRHAFLCAAVLEALVIVAAARIGGWNLLEPLVFLTGMVAAATAAGLYTATRKAYVAGLVERAERVERDRAQADALAAAGERARIAREMHDIVAHHLTVIVALSDAAVRLTPDDPRRAADTMATVGAVGRDALRDTRSLLGVLGHTTGDAGDDLRPLPGLDDLDTLVEQVREAGLAVEFAIHGASPPVAVETQLAAYRLIQESLTNTMKHAPAGARAAVSLRYRTDRLDVRIDDDGAGHAAPQSWHPGRGTSGMRARITALGGELEFGGCAPAGWRVDARLPLHPVVPSGGAS